ncbi:MAG: hypothetical protein ACD_73C00041G0001 [uncultured bacterium]|nr:MAG: hypothetical protein ACD_73C00041G0001 [uncultured bacterium]
MLRLIFMLFVLLTFHSQGFAGEWIDLTHSFDEKTIYWPTASGFKIDRRAGFTKEGYYYSANLFSCPEHGGTHIDAPVHFAKGKKTVDQLTPGELIGEGILIDLEDKIGGDSDYEISEADIKDWEKINGSLSKGSIVLFRTGWARFWNDKKKYLGSDLADDIKNLHFPGLSEKAARYLVSKQIKGVGLDVASLDAGQSRDFKVHRIILGNNLYGLENLAHLDKINATKFLVIVAPMKIGGGTGAPTRVYIKTGTN